MLLTAPPRPSCVAKTRSSLRKQFEAGMANPEIPSTGGIEQSCFGP